MPISPDRRERPLTQTQYLDNASALALKSIRKSVSKRLSQISLGSEEVSGPDSTAKNVDRRWNKVARESMELY